MWDFIKQLIDNWQFGAIKGTCATHALILVINEWLKGTDESRNKFVIQIVLLDYSKAFDHMDPNVLLRKLENMHIYICTRLSSQMGRIFPDG